MELIKEHNFNLPAGQSEIIQAPGCLRIDVIVAGADLQVTPIAPNGAEGVLGTIEANTCAGYDFYCNSIKLTAINNTAQGVVTALK